jgi:hypothetical protein
MTRTNSPSRNQCPGNSDAPLPPFTLVLSLDCKQETTSKAWDRKQVKRDLKNLSVIRQASGTTTQLPLEKWLRLVNL